MTCHSMWQNPITMVLEFLRKHQVGPQIKFTIKWIQHSQFSYQNGLIVKELKEIMIEF